MKKRSAGLLMYRHRDGRLEVFLVHPGGPFWARKDQGAWTLPKGEYELSEEPLNAAKREFREETGFEPGAAFIALRPVRQASGKVVAAWAFEGDCEPDQLVSNTFEMEWPPRSGKMTAYPEVDRAAWFSLDEAREKIHPAQVAILDDLERKLRRPGSRGS